VVAEAGGDKPRSQVVFHRLTHAHAQVQGQREGGDQLRQPQPRVAVARLHGQKLKEDPWLSPATGTRGPSLITPRCGLPRPPNAQRSDLRPVVEPDRRPGARPPHSRIRYVSACRRGQRAGCDGLTGEMKIKLTSIYVDDQEKALRFYTEVLGFAKRPTSARGPIAG
jgi:hypothetical protein